MTHKIYINAPIEYVIGHLRYGHYEGEVELTDEEFEKFKENPDKVFYDLDLTDSLDFLVDDFNIDDIGSIDEVNWKEVE